MKNYLKIDNVNAQIIMDRTFAKGAEIVGSDNYDKLQMARRDYPKYKVVQRTIKRNPNKECYKGLTYDYMRQYIAYFDDNAKESLNELRDMIIISKCHSRRYPVIKDWFLNKYPEVKEFGMVALSGSVETLDQTNGILELAEPQVA